MNVKRTNCLFSAVIIFVRLNSSKQISTVRPHVLVAVDSCVLEGFQYTTLYTTDKTSRLIKGHNRFQFQKSILQSQIFLSVKKT